MIIAVDFDGTVVEQDGRPYTDVTTPLRFRPGAKEGLLALKRAGHVLLLWSARSSRALLDDPTLDPLVRAGVRKLDRQRWEDQLPLHEARLRQMLVFIQRELEGVFDAVDDGHQGKPQVDLFLDDRALHMGLGAQSWSWKSIAYVYGAGP